MMDVSKQVSNVFATLKQIQDMLDEMESSVEEIAPLVAAMPEDHPEAWVLCDEGAVSKCWH